MTASYYLPDVRVEVAFNSGVNTPRASYTWTDVSDYVEAARGITITGGRQNERSTTEPQSITLTLNNSDGRFTPDNAASPHYPNVLIGRPLRVVATWDGVDYSLGFGFVDQWPITWDDGTDATAYVTVSASGRLARMGSGAELLSIIEETILTDDPVAYYVMSEPQGSTRATDRSGNGQLPLSTDGAVTYTAITFGNDEGPTTDELTTATIATSDAGLLARLTTIPAATQSIEAFFVPSATPGGPAYIASLGTDTLWNGVSVGVWWSAGNTGFRVEYNGTTLDGTTTPVVAGRVYHVAATYDGVTLRLYVNGALETSGAVAVGSASTRLALGARSVGGGVYNPGAIGSVSHVAAWNTALTVARLLEHTTSGLTGFAGETAQARILRYAAHAGIPSTEFVLETGQVQELAHINTGGRPVLASMRDVEQAEEGILFDGRDGRVVFHDRAHRYNSTSAFALSTTLQEVEQGLAPTYDRSQLVNVSQITGATGVTARVVDNASRDNYGPAVDPVADTFTNDPDEPYIKASWHVYQFARPRVRVPNVEVFAPGHSFQAPFGVETFGWDAFGGGNGAQLLAADVSTRFTLVPPAQYGASSVDLFVEGYAITITDTSFRFLFNVSPASAYDVFTLDDPARGLDSSYPLAY